MCPVLSKTRFKSALGSLKFPDVEKPVATCDWLRPVLPGSLARSGEEARPGTRVQGWAWGVGRLGARESAAWRWQAGVPRGQDPSQALQPVQGRGERGWRRGKMLGRNGPGASEDAAPGL